MERILNAKKGNKGHPYFPLSSHLGTRMRLDCGESESGCGGGRTMGGPSGPLCHCHREGEDEEVVSSYSLVHCWWSVAKRPCASPEYFPNPESKVNSFSPWAVLSPHG